MVVGMKKMIAVKSDVLQSIHVMRAVDTVIQIQTVKTVSEVGWNVEMIIVLTQPFFLDIFFQEILKHLTLHQLIIVVIDHATNVTICVDKMRLDVKTMRTVFLDTIVLHQQHSHIALN